MDPITITLIALGGLASGALGTIFLPKIYRRILIGFRGKKIHAIGPRRLGKTTLLTYIATGKIINQNEYNATSAPKNLGKSMRALKHFDIEIYASDLLDVSGGLEGNNRDNWEKAFLQSNLTFYITRADCLLDPQSCKNEKYEYAARIKSDFVVIEEFIAEKIKRAKIKNVDQKVKHWFFIVANIWNTSEYATQFKEDEGKISERVGEVEEVKTAIDKAYRLHCVRLLTGRLDTQEGIEQILEKAHSEIEANP